MLGIVVVVFVIMVFGCLRVSKTVRQERESFEQHGAGSAESDLIAALVWLYPIPPLLSVVTFALTFWLFVIPGAIVFFLPGVLLSRRNLKLFDRAGTSRVEEAEKALRFALGLGLAGMAFVILVGVPSWMTRGF